MKFFFDNCISPKLARALNELVAPEHEVHALRARFPPNASDVDWLETLGREGDWNVLSGDLRIRKRPQERKVWRAAKLTTFFMAEGFQQVPNWEQVKWLIDKWPLIVEQVRLVQPGAAFLVPKRGSKLQQVVD